MIKNFIKQNNFEYYENISLKRYNTYRLDTKCRYLIFPRNTSELKSLLKYLKSTNQKHLVLGNGSNVIFKNSFYDGVVILLNRLNKLTIKDEIIEVEAGYSLQKLSLATANLGLTGLEFASGIPGLVGASIAMNAGAYNSSMAAILEHVLVITPDFELVTMSSQDLDFSYRSSLFKTNPNYIIVAARLKLNHGSKQEILEKISKRRIKRLETQPLDMPSAGSVFRNPEGMHAGELIEKCGLKGATIGGAEVSQKHANFIVNKKNATGEDITKLIQKIKDTVQEKYNIELILEQIIVE